MTLEPESEHLRDVLAEAAGRIAPSPLPLAAIEHAGRARRRRRTAGLAAGAALLLAPVAAVSLGMPLPSVAPRHRAEHVSVAQTPAPPARVVAAGQRVDAGNGVSVWLTAEGKYTSVPGQDVLFQPKKDGQQRDGLNLQAQPLAGKWFVSGTYLGTTAAARVVLLAPDGTSVSGHALRLQGARDWGAFYVPATSGLPYPTPAPRRPPFTYVTLYDAAGRMLGRETLPGV